MDKINTYLYDHSCTKLVHVFPKCRLVGMIIGMKTIKHLKGK